VETDEFDAGSFHSAEEAGGGDRDFVCGLTDGDGDGVAGVPGGGVELGAEDGEEVGIGRGFVVEPAEEGKDAALEVDEGVVVGGVVGEFESFGIGDWDSATRIVWLFADGGFEEFPEVGGGVASPPIADSEDGHSDAQRPERRAVAGFVDSRQEKGHGIPELMKGRTYAGTECKGREQKQKRPLL
jgi:hypothetical protein